MKVLVTGGAGFIGSHVADEYSTLGLAVVVVDNLSRGTLKNLPPRARFYKADIRDLTLLSDIFEKERPNVVSHHAAQIDVRRSVADPTYDAECNISGSLNLLKLAVLHKINRFIFASSGGAIYGEPQTLPVPEEYPPHPAAPYGITKLTVEHYINFFNTVHDLQYVVLRYGNVYGPRQSSQGEAGVVSIFSQEIIAGRSSKIYGDGSKTRDYINVSDVVCANVQALERGGNGIFNVATGIPTTDYQVFNYVRSALGDETVEPIFVPSRPGEIRHIHLDIKKARTQLEWQPRIPIEAGIRRATEWFKSHPRST